MSDRASCSTGQPYLPSNGQEGRWFTRRFCERCRCDNGVRDPLALEDTGCDILAISCCGLQPQEWTIREGEPECTAFDPIDPLDMPLLSRAVVAELPFRPTLPPVGRPSCAQISRPNLRFRRLFFQ